MLLALGALACTRQEVPSLIGVAAVNPSIVEAQDTLTVVGEGFADGARGSVTFAGTLFRAGQVAQTGVTISTSGYAITREQLTLVMDGDLIDEFCGESEPVHATFQGSVSVTFAPKTPGAPLVSGRLRGVRLDVYPAPERIAEEFDAEAVREFWGAELGRPPEGDGLLLSHVNSAALVGQLGLTSGDSILRFDGLTVHSLSDIAPYPGQRRASLSVQRKGGSITTLSVDVSGFAPMPAAGWALGASVCAAMALLLLLSRSPLGRLSAWLEYQRMARKPDGHHSLSFSSAQPKPKGQRHALAFLAASALFVLLQFQLFRGIADIDLVVLSLMIVLLLGLKQLWLGGFSSAGWSLWRALRAVARGLLSHLVLLLCLVPAVVSAGSVSIGELVNNQSDALLTLKGLQTPSDYFAAMSMMAALGMSSMFGSEYRARGHLGRLAAAFAAQLETFRLLLGAGVFVCLYAGGWVLPPALSTPRTLLAGALLFQLKLTLVFLFLSWCRHGLPTIAERYLQGYKLRIVLPVAFVSALLSPVWAVEVWPEWLHQSVALMFAWLSCGMVALLLLRLSRRFRGGTATVALNPWI